MPQREAFPLIFAELQQFTHASIAYMREKMSVNTEKTPDENVRRINHF